MKTIAPALLTAACLFSQHVFAESTIQLASDELNEITTQTKNITATIKMWNGTPGEIDTALEINTLSTALVTYIGTATTKLKSQPTTFDETDTFDIGAPTQFLAYAVNASIAALIAQKANFESNHFGSLVITSLQNQLSASKNFSDVLLSYVPSDILPVAEALNSQITDSLNMGIDCFNGMNSSCITAVANASRTYDAAVDTGAIKAISGASRTAAGAAALAVALGAAVFAL